MWYEWHARTREDELGARKCGECDFFYPKIPCCNKKILIINRWC